MQKLASEDSYAYETPTFMSSEASDSDDSSTSESPPFESNEVHEEF